MMMECFNHTVNIKTSIVHYIQLYLILYVDDEAATENRTIDNSCTWHL